MVNFFHMEQIIETPTRITTQSANILDLIITDAPAFIQQSGVLPPVGTCDHSPVYCRINFKTTVKRAYHRTIWNYDEANLDGLYDALSSAPWHVAFATSDNVNDALEYWQNLYLQNINSFIPNKNVIIHPKDKPWVTTELKRLIRKRNASWRRFRRTQNCEHFLIYKQMRNNVVSLNRRCLLQYTSKMQSFLCGPKSNIRKFWSYSRALLGRKAIVNLPPLLHEGQSFISPMEKAEMLNSHFAKQCSLETKCHRLPHFCFVTEHRLSQLVFTPDDVYNILTRLNIHKSTGHDRISNRMLKLTAVQICKPLSDIFNLSLRSGTFPNSWKKSNICPVFKKLDRQQVENYRPISLLCNTSKILERLVFNKLYEYLVSNGLLTSRNSGFKKKDSTTSQLLSICHKIYNGLDSKKFVRMVFLDASRAFDKVWHTGVIFKLKQFGITGSLLKWFHSYLSDRVQRVVLEGHESSWLNVEAGVPQGSILGPLLFLIYTNDIVNNLKTDIHLFADDSSLLALSNDPVQAAADLNHDLNKMNSWAKQWLKTFNASKTVSMSFYTTKIPTNLPQLLLNNVSINEVNEHTHLGLTLSSDMSWDAHISKVITKANKCIGILQYLKFSVPRPILEQLYKTIVLPVIDYGDIIYDNCTVVQKHRLDTIHHKAARIVSGALPSTSTNKLLEMELGWQSLQCRRNCHKLSYLFNIVRGNAPVYLRNHMTVCPTGRQAHYLRAQNNLYPFACHLQKYKESFFPSSVSLWNKLPDKAKSSVTLTEFKNHLSQVFPSNRPPTFFSIGPRYLSVLHTRLRLGQSLLKAHLFKIGLCDTPVCECGSGNENETHFLLLCERYHIPRTILLNTVTKIVDDVTICFKTKRSAEVKDILLNGSPTLTEQQNIDIFSAVRTYIDSSGRFKF